MIYLRYMSSSRSIASARNKRAGGGSVAPTVPTSSAQSRSNEIAVPPIVPQKVSIPQAINLIGHRLNSLEGFMANSSNIIQDMQALNSETDKKYIVDAEVFDSIVGRIEKIETEGVGIYDTATTPINTSANVAPVSQEHTRELHALHTEIDELKTSIIKLQTYVMETNSKLADVVFTGSGTNTIEFGEIFNNESMSEQPLPIMNRNTSTSVYRDDTTISCPMPSPPALVRGVHHDAKFEYSDLPLHTNSVIDVEALSIMSGPNDETLLPTMSDTVGIRTSSVEESETTTSSPM